MRCPQCSKFVPYDTEVEPEEQDAPAAEGGTFTASYRRVLNCEWCVELTCECGQKMEFDLEESCSASSMDELT